MRIAQGDGRRAHYRLLARETQRVGVRCELSAEPGRAFGRPMVWVTLRFLE